VIARRAAALAATLVALAAPSAALAQQCPQTSLSDIEDEVMCPRCERPLSTVDREPQAERERAFIQTLIAQCKSKDEIKTALAAQFGDDVLALPDDEGFDLTAYVVPVLVPLLALAAIGFAAVRWRRRRGPAATAAATATGLGTGPGLDPDDAARLDADLERYKL
jgi:cytochrome c-type biogenesis protein CcmH